MGCGGLEKAAVRIKVLSKGVIGFHNLERAFWLHFGDWMGGRPSSRKVGRGC